MALDRNLIPLSKDGFMVVGQPEMTMEIRRQLVTEQCEHSHSRDGTRVVRAILGKLQL